MGIIQSSVLSPDTIHSTIIQTATELEPKIVAFKAKYAETQESATDLLARATSLKEIRSEDDRELANELMRQSAAGKQATEKTCAELKGQTYKLWKSFTGIESALLAEFACVRTRLEPMAIAYDKAQEAERLKAEREAHAGAQHEAQDDVLDEAIRLEAEGDTEGAKAMLDAPIQHVPVLSMPRKMAGESKGGKYEVEVEDLMELVKAVADGKVPLIALEANMTFLNAQANSLKGFYAIPGTKSEFKDKLRIRA